MQINVGFNPESYHNRFSAVIIKFLDLSNNVNEFSFIISIIVFNFPLFEIVMRKTDLIFSLFGLFIEFCFCENRHSNNPDDKEIH